MNRKVVINLLAYFIISISSFGIILNVVHFFEIRKYETFDFSSQTQIINIRKKLAETAKLTITINKINTTTTLNNDDFVNLKNSINNCYSNLKKLKILKYKGIVRITDTEKYKLLNDTENNSCTFYLLDSFKIISSNDPALRGITDVIRPYLLANVIGNEPINEELVNNYNYVIKNHHLSYELNPLSSDINLILAYTNSNVTSLNFIANWLSNRIGGETNE